MKIIILTVFACSALMASAPKTFTGVITDAMCGKDHAMMNIKTDSKCVTDCVRAGSKYSLLDGSNVYELSDQKTPDSAPRRRSNVGEGLPPWPNWRSDPRSNPRARALCSTVSFSHCFSCGLACRRTGNFT